MLIFGIAGGVRGVLLYRAVFPDHQGRLQCGRGGPYYLPEDTVNALQTQLATFGEDLNGDGKVVVTLNVYTLDYSDEDTQTRERGLPDHGGHHEACRRCAGRS